MKTLSWFSRVALVMTCLGLAATSARGGAPFNTIYHFDSVNAQIATPAGGLVLSNNWIYGMAYGSPTNNSGLFKVHPDGNGFDVLKTFNWSNPRVQVGTVATGNNYGGLVLSPDGSVLYGLYPADDNGAGAVFRINTDGTGFAFIVTFPLLIFSNPDGVEPSGGLALSPDGSVLYGTTVNGGANSSGLIYAVNTNGGNYTVLHSFAANDPNTGTNSDGVNPTGVVISPDGTTLYGTTYQGGSFSLGVFYAFNLSSNQLTVLHYFNFPDDVGGPVGTPLLSGNMLYGVQSGLVPNDDIGMVFSINTNGTNGCKILQTFVGSSANPYAGNAFPVGLLALSGNTLYGTSTYGISGQFGFGNVFEVNIDGTGYADLHEFSNYDGEFPLTGLVASGRNLYGTTSAGGDFGGGTLFQLTPQPVLTMELNAGSPAVRWAPGLSGYNLQTNMSLSDTGSYTNVPLSSVNTNDAGYPRFVLITAASRSLFCRLVSRPVPPTVITAPASAIMTNGATLNGSVLPNGADATYWFQYGPDIHYGQTTASNVISATNVLAAIVTNPVTGLMAGMPCHFQLVGANTAGTNYGEDLTFTNASPPGPITLPATQITSYSAIFNGTDTPSGNNTTYWFEYGTDTNYGESAAQTSLTTSSNQASTSAQVVDLFALTVYHVQLVVVDDSGTNYGGDQSFTTPNDPAPTVTTTPADLITSSSATLHGNVDANGPIANAYFEYGSDTNYGTISTYFFPSGNSTYYYNYTLTGLPANTSYHYRISAYNRTQAADGADSNFTTASLPPTLLSPTNGSSVVTATPLFTWSGTNGTTTYGLYITLYPSGTPVFSSTTLTGTSSRPVTLQNGTNYAWYMTSFNSIGEESAASPSFIFSYQSLDNGVIERGLSTGKTHF